MLESSLGRHPGGGTGIVPQEPGVLLPELWPGCLGAQPLNLTHSRSLASGQVSLPPWMLGPRVPSCLPLVSVPHMLMPTPILPWDTYFLPSSEPILTTSPLLSSRG